MNWRTMKNPNEATCFSLALQTRTNVQHIRTVLIWSTSSKSNCNCWPEKNGEKNVLDVVAVDVDDDFVAYTHQCEAETCIFPPLVLAWSMILHVWLLFIMFFFWAEKKGSSAPKECFKDPTRDPILSICQMPARHPRAKQNKIYEIIVKQKKRKVSSFSSLSRLSIDLQHIPSTAQTYCRKHLFSHSPIRRVLSARQTNID